MNSISFFEIQSSNPERECKFYEAVFGWQFTREVGVPIEYYRIQTGGIPGALLARPAKVPPKAHGTNAFNCSVEVSNIEATEKAVLAHKGKVAMPRFPIPGQGWQGYYMDADRNVFGVFQPDTEAK